MTTNRTIVNAPPESVAAVLSDPRAYAEFVVGSKRVRRFDPVWPDAGAVFHHTLGVGPFVLRDVTRVVDEGPSGPTERGTQHERRFELRAQMRPFAVNKVAFTIRPAAEGTEVEVEERAVEGPAAREARLLPQIPMGRLGRFEEISPLIAFLASDEASYCTGGVFVADGGLTAR